MIAIISFGTSLFLLFALFLFKFFEMRGRFFFYRHVRTFVDQKVEDISFSLLAIPGISKSVLARTLHIFICWISETVLYIVRLTEKKLLKFLNMIKGKGDVNHEKGSASLFLKEISSEKKKDISSD